MSLTSYRTAPPRGTLRLARDEKAAARTGRQRLFEIVNGFFRSTPAAMPGVVLLFQRLSGSTIGAVWFHGRVRDGIGWVTDAMATKLWDRRFEALEIVQPFSLASSS